MKHFLHLFFLALPCLIFSQLLEDFSDGNYTNNPVWSGDDSVFTVVDVNGNNFLRSNKNIPSSSFYLSSPNTLSSNCQWEFFVKLQFNTSSANYVDIYLMADQSNLLLSSLSGYFVRIGGTTDEISLYKTIAGSPTLLINGNDGVTNASSNTLKIKVTRTSLNDWQLSVDPSGTGNNYQSEGTVMDAELAVSSYFGVRIVQSTSSFFNKHFFDDFYIGPIIYDTLPPAIEQITALSATTIDVLFNEAVDVVTVQNISAYSFSPILTVLSATIDSINPALVHLSVINPMTNGTTYVFTVDSIQDAFGNIGSLLSGSFTYLMAQMPLPGDVFINEIMCDPSPSVGLPEVEYVEVFNKSNKIFCLDAWQIGDDAGFGTLDSVWMYPGEYKLLCATSNVDTFMIPGAIAVSAFPSLNNTGDVVILLDSGGVELDRVSYSDAWYKDPTKEDGGYSLERINPNDPCSNEDNWRASLATDGGTPGEQNSVADFSPDQEAPHLKMLLAPSPNFLEVYFTEGMDSTTLADANITCSPPLTIQQRWITSVAPNMFVLEFVESLVPSQVYTIEIEGIGDCWLNTTTVSGTFVLPEQAGTGDVVINEILFDPYTGASDWIELYNTSNKTIDLINWQLANFEDSIANHVALTSHYLLHPNGYVVLGRDSNYVKATYPATIPGTFLFLETPSYDNDSSTVYLLQEDNIMDQVAYSADWHFKLLDITEGVSLERLDPFAPSNESYNWHSAAESIGFATPGGENSQYVSASTNGDFEFVSQVVSPDSDGYEDVLIVNYRLNAPGLIGKFSIFDDRGRIIRTLFKNELLATKGTFTWDGLSDEDKKASVGIYIAVFEVFGLDGDVNFVKRKALVVAEK